MSKLRRSRGNVVRLGSIPIITNRETRPQRRESNPAEARIITIAENGVKIASLTGEYSAEVTITRQALRTRLARMVPGG
jgi:hypothetical protein